MENTKTIVRSNTALSPFQFYTVFLEDIANWYSHHSDEVSFKLFEKGDQDLYNSNYRVDPIAIPLLLSLFEQLSKFHKKQLSLLLYNNIATVNVLEFLYKSDFFYISGANLNPSFPRGRRILSFDENYLGAFKGRKQRTEHRVRAYSLEDDNLMAELSNYRLDEQKRDFLLSHYTYKVREHFGDLLFENDFTSKIHNSYVDILAELITNGVLHSRSNTFALMFVDKYKTKFSISDNGVGFEISMKQKEQTVYYTPNQLKTELTWQPILNNISGGILNNLYSIFETLYFSSLKDRRGLFDLMINVVLKSQGYFRLHCDNCQIIISNRMMPELQELEKIRAEIYNLHNQHLLSQIDHKQWELNIHMASKNMKNSFVRFYSKALNKFSSDVQFSSLRFFKVKFRGVHIEVEIPNL